MAYRLIALDIDGTIRSPEYPLSDRTRETIARVMDAGAVVTVATGRMFESARRASAEMNISAPITSFQGAHVADPATGEVLWHQPLTPDMARAALLALAPWGLEVIGYVGAEVYVSQLTPMAAAYGERNQVQVNLVEDLAEVANSELTRLVVVGAEDEIERLESDLKAHFDSRLYVTRSLPHFCEILHPQSGKEKALAWLCNRLGVGREETLAFGNGYNDVRMLEWASLGIAIGGAVPEVLEVADMVAPPIEEDGAAQVLEDLLARGLIGPASLG